MSCVADEDDVGVELGWQGWGCPCWVDGIDVLISDDSLNDWVFEIRMPPLELGFDIFKIDVSSLRKMVKLVCGPPNRVLSWRGGDAVCSV